MWLAGRLRSYFIFSAVQSIFHLDFLTDKIILNTTTDQIAAAPDD
jgi:hypothetical protein